jgi:O-antigen ligase
MKIREKISNHFDFSILIIITVLFMPFFGTGLSIDPILMPQFLLWSVSIFILLVSFTIQLWRNSDSLDYSVLRRMIFPLFLGYLFFSSVSLIKAVNVTEGVYEVLKIFVSFVYLFIATILLSRNRNYYSILVKTVIVTATILSLIAIYQYFLYAFYESGVNVLYSITSTMAHKNLLSSALFLTLPFCLYALLTFYDYWKFISIVPAILILLNIFLLQTRSVWLGLFLSTVATIIVLGIFAKRLDISKRVFLKGFASIAIVLSVAILVFGCFYLKSNRIDSLTHRIQSIRHQNYPSNVEESPKERYQNYSSNIERILIWKKSAEAIKDSLIFGYGCGNWRIVHLSYGLDKMPKRVLTENVFFQRPHNDYIWVLFETGIFGFMFYMSLFVITFVYIFKIISHHSDRNHKLLSILIFFGIVGYMVDAFFCFPKERIFHSMFLMLMMAVIVSIYHQSFSHKKNVPSPFIFALITPSLALLLFAIAVGYIRLNAEIYTKRAYAARAAQNWPAVISEIDKGYSVFATLDPMSTPLQWYRGEADFLMNNVPQALEDYEKAYKAHPYHIHVLNNLATCYEMQGNHNEAIKYYNKALKLYPQFEQALINLGATYYNSGRYKEAYETLLRCNPNTKDARLKEYLKFVRKKLDKE